MQILIARRRDSQRIFCTARISFDGYPPTLLTKDIIDGVESVIHPAGAHPSRSTWLGPRRDGRDCWKGVSECGCSGNRPSQKWLKDTPHWVGSWLTITSSASVALARPMASSPPRGCRARKVKRGWGRRWLGGTVTDGRKSIAAGSVLNHPRRDRRHDRAAQKTASSLNFIVRDFARLTETRASATLELIQRITEHLIRNRTAPGTIRFTLVTVAHGVG